MIIIEEETGFLHFLNRAVQHFQLFMNSQSVNYSDVNTLKNNRKGEFDFEKKQFAAVDEDILKNEQAASSIEVIKKIKDLKEYKSLKEIIEERV